MDARRLNRDLEFNEFDPTRPNRYQLSDTRAVK